MVKHCFSPWQYLSWQQVQGEPLLTEVCHVFDHVWYFRLPILWGSWCGLIWELSVRSYSTAMNVATVVSLGHLDPENPRASNHSLLHPSCYRRKVCTGLNHCCSNLFIQEPTESKESTKWGGGLVWPKQQMHNHLYSSYCNFVTCFSFEISWFHCFSVFCFVL